VGIIQRFAHPHDDLERLRCLQSRRADEVVERRAFHELHHEIQVPFRRRAEIEDRDNVRMIQLRHRPSLALETLCEVAVHADLQRQQLDRDRAIERFLTRLIDRPHAAAPDDLQHVKFGKSRAASSSVGGSQFVRPPAPVILTDCMPRANNSSGFNPSRIEFGFGGTGGADGSGIAGSSCPDEQDSQFAIHIVRVLHRISDLRAQDGSITFSEVKHLEMKGARRHPDLPGDVRVAALIGMEAEEWFHGVEELEPVLILVMKSQNGELEHAQGPLAVEKLVRSFGRI
jgi:hypothetical protein